jgi:hypothetical protein
MLQKRSIWRALFSALVGGMGGVSLTATLFPYLIAQFLGTISLEALVNMRNMTILMALLWAVGGGIVGWLGGARTGAIVIGLCGAVTGLTLGLIAAPGNPLVTALGIVIGLLYGVPGGFIMGYVFPKPANQV